ncbi:MAG: EamA family transporter [Thermoanaerobaculum sp.]|nr:EamA family transporter [Thermoanaerobaculum sp.]
MSARLREGVAFATICLVWGSTYLAIKVGLESFEPLPFAAVRYWVAAPLMGLWARANGVSLRFSPSRLWPAFGVGVLFIGLCNGMVFWAETRLDSAYTALLITASPLWTAVLSALAGRWLPEDARLGFRGWVGVLLGFAGSLLLLLPSVTRAAHLAAALVVELSVLVWAVGALWVRHLRHRFHALEMATWQMVSGASFLSLASFLGGMPLLHAPLSGRALAALAYLVVFGSVVAFAAYFYLLRVWPATRVATSAYLNPVVAVGLGGGMLGEKVTPLTILGALLVLLGVSLVLGRHGQNQGG